MPIIDLPDGNQIDIPDDAPPEALEAVRTKLRGMGQFQAAAKAPEPAGFLESTARDLVSGFGRGAATIAKGASTAAETFLPKGNELAGQLRDAANSADEYWTKVGDKSTNNPYGQAAVRGVGGAMTSAPTAISAVSGAGAGLGDEAAKRLSGGQDNPLLRAAGSVLGGVAAGTAAGFAGRARPQSADVAREAMEGISEQQLIAAQAYKNQMAGKGIDIDLAQALQATGGHAGNLESIRNFLAGRSQGDQVQKTLRAQPEQLAAEAELTGLNLPGRDYSPQQNANNVQETASLRLRQAIDERSTAVRGLYAAAGDLPPNARNELGAILNKYAMQPGATEVLKERAKEMADKLLGRDPKLGTAVEEARAAVMNAKSASERQAAQSALAQANAAMQGAATKPLRALDVDTWVGELRGPWKGLELKAAYPREQGQVKGLAGELNRKFQELSPGVQKAAGEFKRITDEVVNPLKQGPIGTLNQARGYTPDTQAMVSKFEGLLNKGTTSKTVSDIRTAAKELGKADPEAFRDSFKGWISSKIQDAFEEGVGNTPLTKADPEVLYGTVFKSQKQWQGIKDATAEIALQQGNKPEEVIRGLENLRQLTIAMKNRPESIGGVSPSDLKQLGGNSNVANAVRVMSFLPVNRLGEGIERATFGKTLSQLDTILTSPEGAKMLIELGKVPVMSRKAQVILGTWGGAVGNPDGLSDSNTPD